MMGLMNLCSHISVCRSHALDQWSVGRRFLSSQISTYYSSVVVGAEGGSWWSRPYSHTECSVRFIWSGFWGDARSTGRREPSPQMKRILYLSRNVRKNNLRQPARYTKPVPPHYDILQLHICSMYLYSSPWTSVVPSFNSIPLSFV